MKVTLVKDGEKLSYRIGDSTFYYRRMKSSSNRNLVRKHTRRGELDAVGYGIEICQTHVIDWSGVTGNGKDIKYDPELISQLPLNVLNELVLAIGGFEEDEFSLNPMSQTGEGSGKSAEKNS